MAGLTRDEAAARSGLTRATVDELIDQAIVVPDADDLISLRDARRLRLVAFLCDAGLPLESLVEGIHRGLMSLSFADAPEYAMFEPLSEDTFRDVEARTGIPISVLSLIRESAGYPPPLPDDRLRQDELPLLPFLEGQVQAGFRPASVERLLRALVDNLRRIAEAEAEWWRTEVTEPRMAAGATSMEIAGQDVSARLVGTMGRALPAMLSAQEAHTWTANIVAGISHILVSAGLYQPVDRPPAICFLDITGYTRLTQERGDRAAADLADSLARLVKRASGERGGRPVKWLGDGVMCYFRDPAEAVGAALDMVSGVVAAGLPPAHVGVHTGPVVVQDADYYGATVNLAARIAEYARPGEVLVSDAVRAAASDAPFRFADVGEVELKGVAGTVHLFSAAAPAG